MEKPNIILIVMDAVRASNMSIYGYEEKTTPMLESILDDFALYGNAISSAYWTLPSHASIFTGAYTSDHSLIEGGDILDRSLTTMAEMLRAKGYTTIGICKNPYVSGFSGLDRGFDLFYDFRQVSFKSILYTLFLRKRHRITRMASSTLQRKSGRGTKPSGRTPAHDRVLEKLQEFGLYRKTRWFLMGHSDKGARNANTLTFELIERFKDKPFFLFLHYDETHIPFVLPRDFRNKFLTPKSTNKPWKMAQDYLEYYYEKVKMTESDFKVLEALYNGAISYLDKRIYEIYSLLQQRRLLDNTLLIITSDHGENLGEHGILFHHFCLYDTLIRIPLLIKYPTNIDAKDKLCGTEERVVQNVDLLPTIMDILGIKERTLLAQVRGNSLVTSNIKNRDYSYAISELARPFAPALRPLKTKLKKYDRRLISIRTENKKFIQSSDGNHEFYDLEKDPKEMDNLIDSRTSCVLELKEKLRPWLKEFNNFYERHKQKIEGRIEVENIEAHVRDRLKEMGYF